jgi:hypothetical protein
MRGHSTESQNLAQNQAPALHRFADRVHEALVLDSPSPAIRHDCLESIAANLERVSGAVADPSMN